MNLKNAITFLKEKNIISNHDMIKLRYDLTICYYGKIKGIPEKLNNSEVLRVTFTPLSTEITIDIH